MEFKKTRLAAIFVSYTDTTSTVPPYFYLNIKTGTPSAALRQRLVLVGEQDWSWNQRNRVTLLGELQRMADADGDVEADSVARAVNFPSDHGFDVGLRHNYTLPNKLPGSFNDFTVWHGTGIANGGTEGFPRPGLPTLHPIPLQ